MNEDTYKECLELIAVNTPNTSFQQLINMSVAISLKRIADRLDWDYEDRLRERIK